MPQKKKKPSYNPDAVMEKLIKAMAEDFGKFDDRMENSRCGGGKDRAG